MTVPAIKTMNENKKIIAVKATFGIISFKFSKIFKINFLKLYTQ